MRRREIDDLRHRLADSEGVAAIAEEKIDEATNRKNQLLQAADEGEFHIAILPVTYLI